MALNISGLNIDVGSLLGGVGQLAKDIRTAITGISPEEKAKVETALAQLEANLSLIAANTALEEAKSQDPWTSRARPTFLYVIYIFILFAFPMGVLSVFRPESSTAIAAGANAWLAAIPTDMWMLFGAGYLGYGTFRTYEKSKAGNGSGKK